MKFFYCVSGPNGKPVLMIGSTIKTSTIDDLQQNAQQKIFARGEVHSDSHGLIFMAEPEVGRQLEQDLHNFFSRKVTALQSARVVSYEEDLIRYEEGLARYEEDLAS